MAKVIAVCENDLCGERFGGSEKEASGYCRNCSTPKGREAVAQSRKEIEAMKVGVAVGQ